MFRAFVIFCTCVCTLLGQGRVPEEFRHERILAIVPMIGSGTAEDPFRPQFVPRPRDKSPFLSIHFEPSDDGRSALVEFVAKDQAAFKEILAARGNLIKVFERNKDSKEDVEREFSRVKRDYKFELPGKENKETAKETK